MHLHMTNALLPQNLKLKIIKNTLSLPSFLCLKRDQNNAYLNGNTDHIAILTVDVFSTSINDNAFILILRKEEQKINPDLSLPFLTLTSPCHS